MSRCMATLSDISQRPAPGPERRELRALAAVIAVLATTWAAPGSARAGGLRSGCGALPNAYGPFDYRIEHDKLAIVEAYHFTSQVELLIRGQSGALGADLDYTLRAAPNHHRALVAM